MVFRFIVDHEKHQGELRPVLRARSRICRMSCWVASRLPPVLSFALSSAYALSAKATMLEYSRKGKVDYRTL